MKATELRIGNYVWDGYSGEMIVTSILGSFEGEEMLNLKKQDGLPEGRYICKGIHSIFLTEEWLLKFGFSDIDRPMWVDDLSNYNIGNDNVQYIRGDSWKCIKIRYVHQLQNLYFALTGNELTISK